MFDAIQDNYPKYIITLDDAIVPERKGIQIVNVIDFMSERDKQLSPMA